MVLEGENAIARLREVMGATNPAMQRLARSASSTQPASNTTPCMAPTLRETAAYEIGYFFPGVALV